MPIQIGVAPCRRSRRDCGNLEAAWWEEHKVKREQAAVAATAAILRREYGVVSATPPAFAAVAATAAILRR